ncbi:DUF6082 family protein [Streptomyces hokutonensis]|uniref:DUF6082 family protein n=1 Tax=Streptomyces hokutonensis TaxID=1306990 RepID=A0ABW6MFK1_9ACTN
MTPGCASRSGPSESVAAGHARRDVTGEAGRRYWSRAHASWIASSSGSRVGRRFLAIVGEEHARSAASGPPTRSPIASRPPAVPVMGSSPAWRASVGAPAGLGAGLALGSLLRRRR